MKISIITAVYNRHDTVADAIKSLQKQTFHNYEHIVMDGESTDGTLKVLRSFDDPRMKITSEPDEGIYDALNKGIGRATGDVIGLMHSDDFFASNTVLERVATTFEEQQVDAVYGDLQYVSAKDPDRVVRHWATGEFSPSKLKRGWMPPHPTLYIRKSVIDCWGDYDTSYRIAADYDAILRWFGQGNVRSSYITEVMVKMRAGGESNQSLNKILNKSREDYRALKKNRIGGLGTLALKNLCKVNQFFVK